MRQKTFAQRAVEALDRLAQCGNARAFSTSHLADWLALDSEKTARRVMAQLQGAGCIRYVAGNGNCARLFERVPGVPPPMDARGKSPAAQKALEKGRVLRMKASRGFVKRWIG